VVISFKKCIHEVIVTKSRINGKLLQEAERGNFNKVLLFGPNEGFLELNSKFSFLVQY
jgi:hypothetical protein